MAQWIVHVDMDAFFASLEQRRHGYDERPVVVCVYSGRDKDAGAVSTCGYAARELGISAGMSIKRAKRLAEDSGRDVAFVPIDKEYYQSIADEIRSEVYDPHADIIEQASIDEAYLDVSDRVDGIDEIRTLASSIQDDVEQVAGVTCSIGAGPNKLIAKMASDRDKPEGITIIAPDEVDSFLEELEMADLHGVGSKTIDRLQEMGITSIPELQDADRSRLVAEFGEKRGVSLWEKAHGRDTSPVEPSEQQQISRLMTLEENSRNSERLEEAVSSLAGQIIDAVEDHQVMFGRVVLLIVDEDNQMRTRSVTLTAPVTDREIVVEQATSLLDSFLQDETSVVRRIGLRVADLSDGSDQQRLSAFTE